ncbi:hypothetical protein LXL04_012130 [Taraxacum kok-saghyz]
MVGQTCYNFSFFKKQYFKFTCSHVGRPVGFEAYVYIDSSASHSRSALQIIKSIVSFVPRLIDLVKALEMEWNSQTPQSLSQSFLDTLSPHSEPRRRAENNLSNAADNPNYGLAVLRIVADTSVDEHIRQCAAVNFKNHLKTRWLWPDLKP